MYDTTTWADIQAFESEPPDGFEQGTCEQCGVTGWLAPLNGQQTCTECESELLLQQERERIDDYDDGVYWEDDI
jgi:hypothetical protein